MSTVQTNIYVYIYLTLSLYLLLTDANECKDSPCQHATECVNLVGDYKCHCEKGWTGKDCNIS